METSRTAERVAGAAHAATDAGASRRPWSFPVYLGLFWLGVALFLAFDLLDGASFNGDTDDLLRALEIRRFLGAGDWYDLSFPAVRMPEIYVAPWSRLIDLPYAAIAWLLAPILGLERGADLAFLLWPPAMALVYGWLAVIILRRLAPAAGDLPVSALLGVLLMSVYAIWEFSPGRIDHHNAQILLLLAVTYGICRWDRAGGVLVGAAVPASVAIGLETLPVLAVALLSLVLAWALGLRGSRSVLRAAGLACLVASPVLAVAQIPPADLLLARNDAWSAPYVLALMAFGALAAALPSVIGAGRPGIIGLAAFALPGLGAVAMILWLYPDMLAGPYPMISGLARTYWFDRIHQEGGALVFMENRDYRALLLLISAVAVATGAAMGSIARARREPAIAALAAIAWAAILMTLYSNRFLRIALAIVPLLLPVAIAHVREAIARSPRETLTGLAAAAVLACALPAASAMMPSRAQDYDAFDQFVMNDCRLSDFSALGTIAPGRMLTPPGLGLQILYRNVPGISVSSISFHRSAPAMSQVLELYMTVDPARRAALLAGADYLALCHSPVILKHGERLPLFTALLSGKAVPGITPVARSGDLVIYRIDHAALD